MHPQYSIYQVRQVCFPIKQVFYYILARTNFAGCRGRLKRIHRNAVGEG